MHLFLLSIWYSVGIIKNNYSSKDILSKFLQGITLNQTKLQVGDIKAVYCPPAYLTYMQTTSWEMLG